MAVDPASDDARLTSLTGLRFPLACAVLVFHLLLLSGLFGMDNPFIAASGTLTMLATAAVSSFFVLSGFVLTWTARQGDTAWRFWRRRVVKIFPNHIVTLGLMLVLLAVTVPAASLPFTSRTVGETIANLMLVHTWIPDLPLLTSGTSVSWSLAVELFFYLLFPAIYLVVRRVAARRLWFWVAGVAVFVLAFPALVTLLTPDGSSGPLAISVERWWLVYLFPPSRLAEFVLGMFIARTVRAGLWPKMSALVPIAVVVGVFLAEPVLPNVYKYGASVCLPFAALIACLATADTRGRHGMLASRPMLLLGNASFALYMVHIPVIFAIRHLIGADRTFGIVAGLLVALGMAVACILAALALWRWIETPMMARFARPRSKPPVEPALT